MGMRYTDRDCVAALVRVAAAMNEHGEELGVSIPTGLKWTKPLEELAERLNVPVRRWGDTSCSHGRRLMLDHSPMGGVRPALCMADTTTEYTPCWWSASAGLGPGALPRREFCAVLSAVEAALSWASDPDGKTINR